MRWRRNPSKLCLNVRARGCDQQTAIVDDELVNKQPQQLIEASYEHTLELWGWEADRRVLADLASLARANHDEQRADPA